MPQILHNHTTTDHNLLQLHLQPFPPDANTPFIPMNFQRTSSWEQVEKFSTIPGAGPAFRPSTAREGLPAKLFDDLEVAATVFRQLDDIAAFTRCLSLFRQIGGQLIQRGIITDEILWALFLSSIFRRFYDQIMFYLNCMAVPAQFHHPRTYALLMRVATLVYRSTLRNRQEIHAYLNDNGVRRLEVQLNINLFDFPIGLNIPPPLNRFNGHPPRLPPSHPQNQPLHPRRRPRRRRSARKPTTPPRNISRITSPFIRPPLDRETTHTPPPPPPYDPTREQSVPTSIPSLASDSDSDFLGDHDDPNGSTEQDTASFLSSLHAAIRAGLCQAVADSSMISANSTPIVPANTPCGTSSFHSASTVDLNPIITEMPLNVSTPIIPRPPTPRPPAAHVELQSPRIFRLNALRSLPNRSAISEPASKPSRTPYLDHFLTCIRKAAGGTPSLTSSTSNSVASSSSTPYTTPPPSITVTAPSPIEEKQLPSIKREPQSAFPTNPIRHAVFIDDIATDHPDLLQVPYTEDWSHPVPTPLLERNLLRPIPSLFRDTVRTPSAPHF